VALTQPKAFFDAVRQELFSGNLTMGQAAWDDFKPKFDIRFVAYSLATAYWETGQKMLPVREEGEGRGHQYGIPVKPWDQVYYGRGLVQLTWYRNYDQADVCLRQVGLLAPGEDLVRFPDLALRPDLAAAIMLSGMTGGWFTGAKLADFFNAKLSDPVSARKIINGLDHAGEIAGFHSHFWTALKAGGY
jgi:putative chitinase